MAICMRLIPICLFLKAVLKSRVWHIIKACCFMNIGDIFFFRVEIARRSFSSCSTEFKGLECDLGGMVVVSIASIVCGMRNQRSWLTCLHGRLIY